MAEPDPFDWDSIREAEGFRVGDQVRARGPEVGEILHIIKPRDKYRAHVHWPTVPFECEGRPSPGGSENFIDLEKLSKAPGQLTLI